MLTMFLFKRVFLLAIVFSIISFFVDNFKFQVPLGIIIGSLVSVYKVRLNHNYLKMIAATGRRTAYSVLMFIFSQTISLLILTLSILINFRFFIGMSFGLILMALFICINSVTEKIGLTHNNWQQ